jgi:hypothetical protein
MIRKAHTGYGGESMPTTTASPWKPLRERVEFMRMMVATGRTTAAQGTFPYYRNEQ